MTPPEQNGTLIAWMQRIDERLEGIEERLIDKDDHQALQERVSRVEDKTHNLAVKVSGIAALMSGAGVWLKSQFFGQ